MAESKRKASLKKTELPFNFGGLGTDKSSESFSGLTHLVEPSKATLRYVQTLDTFLSASFKDKESVIPRTHRQLNGRVWSRTQVS